MAQILRGNFQPRRNPLVELPSEDLTSRFEAEALRRLGGSIAFVSKKRFTLGLDTGEGPRVDSSETDDAARS